MNTIAATSALTVLALLVGACSKSESPKEEATNRNAAASVVPAELGALKQVHAFGDIFLAGQPTEFDVAAAKARGVKTVIDLRGATEDRGFDERVIVEGLGLKYVSLPFKKPDELTDAVFDRARQLLDDVDRPVLVHCGSANRVGAVWIPWRVIEGGLSIDDAIAEAKTIGLKTPEFAEKAKEYVARHPPAKKDP